MIQRPCTDVSLYINAKGAQAVNLERSPSIWSMAEIWKKSAYMGTVPGKVRGRCKVKTIGGDSSKKKIVKELEEEKQVENRSPY